MVRSILNDLVAFVMVAREGSCTRAACRRGASASASAMMRLRFTALLYCALCLGATAHGASTVTGAGTDEVPVGQVLGDATLQGLNGPPVALSSLRGRPLLINVWASWCGPCRAEMASLERLAWLDPARGYAIIGISTDDYMEEANGWLGQSHATISHYIDRALQMEHMLGAARLPLTVLVDAQGRVLDRIYGAHEWDSADSLALINRTFGRAAHSR